MNTEPSLKVALSSKPASLGSIFVPTISGQVCSLAVVDPFDVTMVWSSQPPMPYTPGMCGTAGFRTGLRPSPKTAGRQGLRGHLWRQEGWPLHLV